uniref:Uncharacterized protein n=1 Tax=Trichuris muris TaxID=70415 RepID=A0A5S6QEV2_TRIMR
MTDPGGGTGPFEKQCTRRTNDFQDELVDNDIGALPFERYCVAPLCVAASGQRYECSRSCVIDESVTQEVIWPNPIGSRAEEMLEQMNSMKMQYPPLRPEARRCKASSSMTKSLDDICSTASTSNSSDFEEYHKLLRFQLV